VVGAGAVPRAAVALTSRLSTRLRARASLGGPSRACDRCDDGGHNDARVVGSRHGRAERLRAGSGREPSLGSAAAATEWLSPASTWRACPSWAGPPGSGASASWPLCPSAELRSPSSRLCAWARRNSDQLGPIRRGAGPSRPRRRRRGRRVSGCSRCWCTASLWGAKTQTEVYESGDLQAERSSRTPSSGVPRATAFGL
jgi:hypothetical protein